MNKLKTLFFYPLLFLGLGFFLFSDPSTSFASQGPGWENEGVDRLKYVLRGQILLQVQDQGQAYYISPEDLSFNFLGRPEDAFRILQEKGVGISNEDLSKIRPAVSHLTGKDSDGDGLPDKFERAMGTDPFDPDTSGNGYTDKTEIKHGYDPLRKEGRLPLDEAFARKHQGRIFLQVEGSGEAWYVNPEDNLRYFLGRPADVFNVMGKLGRGFPNNIFDKLKGEEVELSKRIVIDTGNQRLSYYWGGVKMGKYLVSTGKASTPTPPGSYHIINKVELAWSPLGLWMPYWMGLGTGRIGIHQLPYWPNGYREGVWNLGTPVSHGCIRLGIEESKRLYEWAEVGTPVYIY